MKWTETTIFGVIQILAIAMFKFWKTLAKLERVVCKPRATLLFGNVRIYTMVEFKKSSKP